MKNKLIVIIALTFFVSTLLLANNNNNIFDIDSRKLVKLVEEERLSELSTKMYSRIPMKVDARTGKMMVSMFIKVDLVRFNNSAIEQLSGQVNTSVGNIITVRLPVTALPRLRDVPGIEWVELAKKVELKLDVSRDEIGATLIHDPQGDLGYTGENVVVGVVDAGIDFEHPDFKNSDGTSRVAYLWDQLDNSTGSPPSGFDYGQLWTDTDINNGTCTFESDALYEGHGTHVSGTAAGNGLGSPESADYTGIAPDAPIVFMNTTFENAGIIDGINFVFQTAEAQGLPAVVNLSLGLNTGPHDGTSLFEQVIDELVGPGRIIVIAAGNEGSDLMHANYTLNNSTTTFFFDVYRNDYAFIDIWGQLSSSLEIALRVWHTDGSGLAIETPFYSSDNVAEEQQTDLYSYGIYSEVNQENGDEHFVVECSTDPSFSPYTFWAITISGTGEFDAYAPNSVFDDISEFESVYELDNEWLSGDNDQSINSMATSNGIITVGAYATKSSWTDFSGNGWTDPTAEVSEIANFSSRGPTRDGRIKPDITAPGQQIAAPLDQYNAWVDSAYIAWLPYAPYLLGGYLLMPGTSMATPHIAGVVALMLESNPNLTPEDVKDVFVSTSRSDEYTGDLLPDNTWGEGKVDAYAAVQSAENVAIDDKLSGLPQTFELAQNYPNPFNPITTIEFTLPWVTNIEISIFNILGEKVTTLVDRELQVGSHSVQWNVGNSSSGIYFYRLKWGDNEIVRRMVLLK